MFNQIKAAIRNWNTRRQLAAEQSYQNAEQHAAFLQAALRENGIEFGPTRKTEMIHDPYGVGAAAIQFGVGKPQDNCYPNYITVDEYGNIRTSLTSRLMLPFRIRTSRHIERILLAARAKAPAAG